MEGVISKQLVLNLSRMTIHNGPGIRTLIQFKGCPLHCLWCSTPESQKEEQEIAVSQRLCIDCGKCVPVCPTKAISMADHAVVIDRSSCNLCGKCTEVCYAQAIKILGLATTVDELLEEIRKDIVFYKHSGGGVTISGGEPLLHPDFISTLAQKLKKENIGVGIDTCGHMPWASLEQVLPYTDFFLWDLKHMDSERHRTLTGVSNKLILRNIRSVAERDIPLYLRIPMITGYNDSEVNIRSICKFAQNLSSLAEIHLLPLHHLGQARYESLNRAYPIDKLPLLPGEFMQNMKQVVESYGLKCSIVG